MAARYHQQRSIVPLRRTQATRSPTEKPSVSRGYKITERVIKQLPKLGAQAGRKVNASLGESIQDFETPSRQFVR